jgi:hypothetical protein
MPATCPAYHILLDLIIPIVFGKSKSYEAPHAIFSSPWLFHQGLIPSRGKIVLFSTASILTLVHPAS